MLRLLGGQVESLFDLGLPVEVRELPADLAVLDRLLEDAALFTPVVAAWDVSAVAFGRPSIPIEQLVRLMVVKQRSGWGYETLVREVSDSLHLRRFCRVALTERVPDESTIRKLVRRLGPDVIDAVTRALIVSATTGERRFVARTARIDSTVVEADIRYPTDLGLAADATRVLARAGATVRGLTGSSAKPVRDRSKAVAARLRRLSRSLAARTGEAKPLALRLTGEAGALVEQSVREAQRLVATLRERARGRGAARKRAAADRLEVLIERATKVAEQIRKRLRGERIADRLVSLADPDARPIRKGKLRAPTEFGYVVQLAEVCEHSGRGARGLIVPAASVIGSANEAELLPITAAELDQAGLHPRVLALDGGFTRGTVATALPDASTVFISGRQTTGSRRRDRRLARFRVGIEGRISHLKRRYGLGRSRLRGHTGQRIWTAWAILAYNLDTLAVRAA